MITYLRLSEDVIEKVKNESVPRICKTMGNDVKKIVLYGSCSRGDFSDDSDIDIALLTSCDRLEVKKYNDSLAKISAEFAYKYLAIVNFVCFPEKEFEEKKRWYPYFKNMKLLSDRSFKSANNRAYYAMEKALNALLIDKHIETKTHSGAMRFSLLKGGIYMNTKNILARAAEIITQRTVRQDKDSFATLITIDPDGSPVPTTISPSRSEGIHWLTFCTGLNAPSPVRLGRDNRAAVCLNSPTYHISLTGTAEVCTDPETCREMWYEGLANHFSGPDDPNLCVIRFTTQRYSLFIEWESVKGEVRI